MEEVVKGLDVGSINTPGCPCEDFEIARLLWTSPQAEFTYIKSDSQELPTAVEGKKNI